MWRAGESKGAGTAVTIFVDGQFVGNARTVEAREEAGRVVLEGLDSLSLLYFSALVGPVGESGAAVGHVSLLDERSQRRFEVAGARVFGFSSGTHHLSLSGTTIARLYTGGAELPAG
jgi:hypothetical protein